MSTNKKNNGKSKADADVSVNFHIEEYKMLREEIVIYMDKLQTVRNMMYVAVVAIITFSASKENMIFYTLMPLAVIFPTYACAVVYWEGVRKASAYLVVFHESSEMCPYHWESRHSMFKRLNLKIHSKKRRKGKSANDRGDIFCDIKEQLSSYYFCAGICIIYYTILLCQNIHTELSKKNPPAFWDIEISGIPIEVYFAIVVVVAFLAIIFFVKTAKLRSYNEYVRIFQFIRENEVLTKRGMWWKDEKNLDQLYERCFQKNTGK